MTTPNIGLAQPIVNVQTDWGGPLNNNFSIIDSIFASSGAGTSVGINVGAGNTATLGGTIILGSNDGTGSAASNTLRGANKTGANVVGADTIFQAGNGTGTGGSGRFVVRTAPADISSTTPNTFRDNLIVNSAGAIAVNNGSYGSANQVLLSGGSGAASTWGNVNGDVINFAGQSHGDVIYRGTSAWERLPAGTAGQVLRTAGPAANPTWAFAESMTLLGTIATTSGTTQSLSALTLTSYKKLVLVWIDVSANNSVAVVNINDGTTNYNLFSGPMVGSTYFINGETHINLENGVIMSWGYENLTATYGVSNANTTGTGGKIAFGRTRYTTASTSVTITCTGTSSAFDAGSVKVYGVR